MSTPASKITRYSVVSVKGHAVHAADDVVVREEPLEIQLSYLRKKIRVTKSLSVTMCTPGNDEELAAGFLFTEGLIDRSSQITSTQLSDAHEGQAGRRILVTLADDVRVDLTKLERNFYAHSSCGLCGKTTLEAVRLKRRVTPTGDTPQLSAAMIHRWPEALSTAQAVFAQTGGLHAAALINADGQIIAVREDVGRHNAVDKLIGARLLAGASEFGQLALFVSARASFELMQKTVVAGIPVLAAVGAPSSMAVELARETGTTLLGFVRDGRFNVYAGAQRIREIATE